LLLERGEAWLAAGEERLHVLGPAFVWIPGDSAGQLTVEAGGSGQLLSIRRDLIEQTFRLMPEAGELMNLLSAEQPLAIAIEAHTAAQLAGMLVLVSGELQASGPGAETVIGSALVISFVQIWRHVGASALARGGLGGTAAILMRFRQLVEERFREHWSVGRYAGALGLTSDRLHAICTRTLGRTPRLLVQQRLVYEAVVRLERSAVTIKQLGFLLGFKDAAYFNRFFARHLGMPPARYRRERAHRDAAGRVPHATFTFADWP
jgi:AraC family transcriptional activator of pobA